jgi:hypothetical protein
MGVAACRKGARTHQTQSSSSPDRTRRRACRRRGRSPRAFQTSMASASSSSTSSRPLTSVLPKVPARVEAWWDSSEQVPALAGFCSPLSPADGEKCGFDSRRLHKSSWNYSGSLYFQHEVAFPRHAAADNGPGSLPEAGVQHAVASAERVRHPKPRLPHLRSSQMEWTLGGRGCLCGNELRAVPRSQQAALGRHRCHFTVRPASSLAASMRAPPDRERPDRSNVNTRIAPR